MNTFSSAAKTQLLSDRNKVPQVPYLDHCV